MEGVNISSDKSILDKSLDSIFLKMGLTKENGLYRKGDELPDYPSRIKIALKLIDYDAIYNIKNKPIILFKKFDIISEDRIYSLHKKIWNFGEVPILFIILPTEIRIYNGYIFDKEKNEIWKKILDDKSKVWDEFSFINIISGKLWDKYRVIFSKKTHVRDYLLKNLGDAREILHQNELRYQLIHNILGRLIFSRYLIDRGALSRDFFYKKYNCDFEDIILHKDKLYDYFNYLKVQHNGDLFPLEPNEKDKLTNKHLDVLFRLFKGYEISTGQTTLFDIYDFSVIPVELISNIYETFLDKEDVGSNKSYYTPLFLVDHILNETLDKILCGKNDSNCKILDPACGSGVFLVEALRRLIEKEEGVSGRKLTANNLENIILNNIFGVDRDEDAINLSIFSLYITLLDYQEPKGIAGYVFPVLKNSNLFVSDFFNLTHEFNEKITKMDLIIGNPPWGSEDGPHLEYCKNNEIPISNKQTAMSFLARVKDFSSSNAEIALIVTSKVLYNLKAKEFRLYFLNNFLINRILEFSSVRRSVFREAIGPGAVIFYKCADGENTEGNVVEHISLKPNRFFDLFRAIVIEKFDVKFIQQKYFIDNDWLWKIILYGNVLDFYFIKRLKSEFEQTITKIIRDGELLKGVGIQRKTECTEKPKDASYLIGIPYLNVNKHMLQRYFINIENASKWNEKEVHRSRNPELLKPPYILIKKTPNPNFQTIAAFSNRKMVFTDSVTAIKGKSNDIPLLKNILGILNSKLFTYYIFTTGSSAGVERDQSHIPDKFSFPVVFDDRIYNYVEKLEKAYEEKNNRTIVNKIEFELNEFIFNLYNVNSIEKDIIDYTTNISIPLFRKKEEPFAPPTKNQLIKYANIFFDHFFNIFNGPNEFFAVDIYQIDYFVAMNFKILNKKPEKPIGFIKDRDIYSIINAFGNLSIEELTDNLYIQKDIKGFDETSFYVIKPNEYKNWHRAIGRLDLSEFIDAMIKTGAKRFGENMKCQSLRD